MTLMYFLHRLIVCVLCSVLLFVNSWAWGMTGHRIVGALAELHMTPKAREQVAEVLHGYHLQDVSNWADEIRSENNEFTNSLRNWHFIDLSDEAQLDVALTAQWPADLNHALQVIIRKLEVRDFDDQLTEPVLLSLLIHLVADAHQPLHVGNDKDHGGNACHVQWFYDKWTTNLHSVWDTRLIESFKLTYSEYVDYLNHTDAATVQRWQKDSVKQWLIESYRLHSEIYPTKEGIQTQDYCVKYPAKPKSSKVPKLGYDYQSRMRPILHQRLSQAGIRLAGVLNRVYDPQGTAMGEIILKDNIGGESK